MFRRLFAVILFSAAAISAVAAQDGGLSFSITEWDTGELQAGITAEQRVTVENRIAETVSADLISTCSCLTVRPEHILLGPGGSAEFTLYFDSSDDSGDFEKLLIIQTDSDAMPKGFFVITGSVAGAPAAETGSAAKAEPGAEGSSAGLIYYYTPGCRTCNEFLRDARLPVSARDITGAEYYEELQLLLEERGEVLQEVPVLVSADGVYQGEKQVIAAYKAIESGVAAVNAEAGRSSGGISIAILPVLAAGLLDGVNPCAFTTLIFLLSALSVAGRSRRETLLIGLFFTVTVFITYYLIGLGFFKIIRLADSFELVSRIIRWVLIAVLLMFAGLSFYDYFKVRAGKASDIILQLPDGVKRRMHSSIRSYTKSAALAGSSVIMGFLISIFELGCTGQIYFPTITYIIQTEKAASGFAWLALYNLAFILPLAAVFVVVYFGITSKKITRKFQSNLGLIKLLTAFLFIIFAILMIVLI